MSKTKFDVRRISELQPRRQTEFRQRGSDRMGIGSYLGIGFLVAAAAGAAGFCFDVGGIRTATGRALAPYEEASNKRKYNPVNVNGIDYVVIGNDAYTLGIVTPIEGDGRITLRQRHKGSVQNWRAFDTATRTLNIGKHGGEPMEGVQYIFPSSQVPKDTTLYERVIAVHAERQ